MLENSEGQQRAQRLEQRPRRVQVIVIGAGQAGLAAGRYLAQAGVDFLILEAADRVGDVWRNRWDSLRLFTAAEFAGLPGLPYPGDPDALPTKDQLADYLETYASHFRLPVRFNTSVERLERDGDRYVITTSNAIFEADHVVVATGSHQATETPAWAELPGARYRPDSVERLQESIATGSWWRARCRCRQQRRGACAGGGRGRSSRLALGPRCRPGAAVLPIRERTAVLVSRHTSLHDEDADRPQDPQGAAGRP